MSAAATVLAFIVPFVTSFSIHYFATHIYANVCVPLSPAGVIQSLLLTGGPVCSMILTVVNYTHNAYGAVILGMSGVIIQQLTNAGVGATAAVGAAAAGAAAAAMGAAAGAVGMR
jgi:hypothetical protein